MSESSVETPETKGVEPSEASSRIGDVLAGKYKITDVVVDSPFASLFAARDLSSDSHVLIETVKITIPTGLDNFARLAKACLEMDHKNVLNLLAYEEVDGSPFFVWEFVDFVRLEDLIDSGGFIEQESEIFDTLTQVCHGLQYAHERGIAHGYLHPRNICLADIDGEICIKIANFGFSHLLAQFSSYQTAGVIEAPKLDNDIYQLSILAYFVVTGESPDPLRSLDHLLDPRSHERVSFETLADVRADLRGYEELLQILEDSVDPDANWRIKEPKEFQDGLIDWMESVKSAPAEKSEVAEKVAEDQRSSEPAVKKKRKITNNMRTTVRQMVSLKSKQSTQEETAVMMLANIAAAKGPRQSPITSVIRLSVALLSALAVTGIAIYIAFVKPKEFKDVFVAASEQVSSVIKPAKPDEDEISIEPIAVPPVAKSQQQIAAAILQPQGELQKPATRLPKFDSNVLHDLYKKDFVPSNNQKRRGFRIEYREFRDEWIAK